MSGLILEGLGDTDQLITEGHGDEREQPQPVVVVAPTYAPYRGGGGGSDEWRWIPPPRTVPAHNPFDDVPLFDTPLPVVMAAPPSPTAAEPTIEEQTDQYVEMAAGLLDGPLDFWPLSAAKALYARKDGGLAGLKEAAPEVTNAVAKAIGRHTVRELAYSTLKGWFKKK